MHKKCHIDQDEEIIVPKFHLADHRAAIQLLWKDIAANYQQTRFHYFRMATINNKVRATEMQSKIGRIMFGNSMEASLDEDKKCLKEVLKKLFRDNIKMTVVSTSIKVNSSTTYHDKSMIASTITQKTVIQEQYKIRLNLDCLTFLDSSPKH